MKKVQRKLSIKNISWAAQASRQRIMDITVANIKAFIEGNPINVVNPFVS